MRSQPKIRAMTLAVSVAVGLAGCATQGGGNNPGSSADAGGGCGVGTVALGAVGGALVGGLLGGKKGAVIGAGAGAGLAGIYCFAIKSESRQTKTAAQVEQEYRQENRGSLPDKPMLTAYSTQITPANGVVSKGGVIELTSRAQVVNGTVQKADKVEEEITLYYDKEPMQKAVKAMPNSVGGFENKTTIAVPKKFQEGTYSVASRVLVNGEPVGQTSTAKVKVVTINGQMTIAMADKDGVTTLQ